MSAKKYQQVNLSLKGKSDAIDLIFEISSLLKKIKSGIADVKELNKCENLTKTLQGMLKSSIKFSESDLWFAKEIVEMSQYTCKKYGHLIINDKI